jgi:sugar diacid utilization regulator
VSARATTASRAAEPGRWRTWATFGILSGTGQARGDDLWAAAEPAREELSVARELVTLYRRLSGTAAQSADVSAVTDLLASRLDAPVWVVNDKLAVIVASGPEVPPDDVTEHVRLRSSHVRWDRILHVAAETGSAVRSPETADGATVVVAPIMVDYEVAAFLMTVEGKRQGGDFALLATEHAATVCGVMLSRERALAAAAGRARDDLVEGLLRGRAPHADELSRWARHLGLDTSVPNRVLVLVCARPGEPGSERHRRVHEVIQHFCQSRGTGVVTVVRDAEVVVLLPDDPPGGPSAMQLASDCLAYCRDLFPDVRVATGLSGICAEAAAISRAYDEARRTVGAAARLNRHGEVVTAAGLGIHRLLLQLPDLGDLRAFADDVLGPLRRYDAEHGSQLIETLAAFFQEGPSLRRIADRLHVHPNTVTYRLRRIAEIAALDLGRYRDRLMAQVALEILDIQGASDE